MIIGIFPDTSTTETTMNNLAEAEFDLSAVSVIMKDLKLRDIIAQPAGPLKGATASTLYDLLVEAGLPPEKAGRCRDLVNQGKVLIAMDVPEDSRKAAKEMLQDLAAEVIEA